jgi:hypothetical protein
MRYQLRYIRAPRTRSSPGAKHDDSPRKRARTNPSVRWARPGFAVITARSTETPARANLRRRSPLGAGPVAQWESVRFTRGRSLVRSQPGPQMKLLVRPYIWACSKMSCIRVASTLSAPARKAFAPHHSSRAVNVSSLATWWPDCSRTICLRRAAFSGAAVVGVRVRVESHNRSAPARFAHSPKDGVRLQRSFERGPPRPLWRSLRCAVCGYEARGRRDLRTNG